ncbi:macro domain-containing protein [Celerinatantimonas yamalensis]|uniref:Phosphatase n=1 Tax=Celerinatantimonas yamalensis TaxID=559956 RepID=A0ABW9G9M3_9GAMM
MKIVDGDLITLAKQGRFDVIVHGCNCFNTMDNGIAAMIKQYFPEAYEADRQTVPGDRCKLGSLSAAKVERDGVVFTVINAYTQFDQFGDGNADYEAIQMVFAQIRQEFHGQRIGYPLICAGGGGGNWSVIEKIIEQELADEDYTLVRYPASPEHIMA